VGRSSKVEDLLNWPMTGRIEVLFTLPDEPTALVCLL
jgi:hypothetical protein